MRLWRKTKKDTTTLCQALIEYSRSWCFYLRFDHRCGKSYPSNQLSPIQMSKELDSFKPLALSSHWHYILPTLFLLLFLQNVSYSMLQTHTRVFLYKMLRWLFYLCLSHFLILLSFNLHLCKWRLILEQFKSPSDVNAIIAPDSAATELVVTVATCVAFDLTLQIGPTMTFFEKSSKKQRKLPFYRKKSKNSSNRIDVFHQAVLLRK